MGGEARGSLQWLGNSEKRDRNRGFVTPSEAHPPRAETAHSVHALESFFFFFNYLRGV